ncbi:uncharacterized protein PGTG_22127 [Puccinia graminis f. sp. tritici CRL 75-36-700-3]|uniref:ubiquitinyl hydrolase 1 n=1 Tax=Puccinia graminis f. sp. tritici (strain CRL 75-36-700-3 / race SCCL) TaxID=418459 RepID=H6QTL7_PUCGT|nr:uncharacterized protein PGTG_22127 [Puccinia graminis f. sp. tritici CRL 75-36-700-3]EHS64232.1 hypothetical protein PGTG_22127 [Puccinia graminis f. sp. tritici CRL 75-36-700-3]
MSYYDIFLTTKIITDETFRQHQGFDMALLDDKTMPPSQLLTLTVLKTEPFLNFKSRLAQSLGHSPNCFRLWTLAYQRHCDYLREATTTRLIKAVPESDPELTMQDVMNSRQASSPKTLIFYLEVLDRVHEARSGQIKESHKMVFVKHFDAKNQKLVGIGHFHVQSRGSLDPLIKNRMNLPSNAKLQVYKELGPGKTNVDNPKVYSSDPIRNGDIFCFQVELSDSDIAELKRKKLYVDVVEFYNFLENRVLVHFKPRHEAMSATIEFSLVLSKKDTYEQMSKLVSAKLNHSPENLRFTGSLKGFPQNVIHGQRTPNQNSGYPSYSSSDLNNILFYELLDLPTGEVQQKRMLKVTWTGADDREEGKYSLLMPKTSSMNAVADKLSTMVTFSKNSSRKIKLFTIKDGKIQVPFTGEEILKDVLDVENIYAAEVSTMTVKQYDPAAMLKMLEFVTKLNVDGRNYQQWLKALESVLGMATGKAGILTSPGHTIGAAEDLMIKQAITASVDSALVSTVLEAESGMVAFAEIQKLYTLKSRSGHIRLMKEILRTKFDMNDGTVGVESHFRRVEDLVETLFESGFQLTHESFKGLLFHLSLPELDAQPFVNICKRIDERPGGACTPTFGSVAKAL